MAREKGVLTSTRRRRFAHPIGIDLVLHEKPDPQRIKPDLQRIVRDGSLPGEVAEAAARRYASPLAIPLMDLWKRKICFAS